MHMINKHAFRWSAAASFAAWLTLGAFPTMAAGVYKWTDDQGIVHYSDQMPADAVNKGGAVFDKQGRQVKKIDPTLTPAQAKAKEAEDERQRLIAKAQEDKSRRDIALTHSYTSEEEIDFARSRALLAVESQLKSAETYIADLTKRQQELKKDKLAYGTKPVPTTLENELAGLDEELARQDKVLAQRRAEISAINAKYESDKQRWREIRTDQGKPLAPAAAGTPPAPPSKSATSTVTK
jgi:chromosome segregation ATPase